jgi:hypothetical protein
VLVYLALNGFLMMLPLLLERLLTILAVAVSLSFPCHALIPLGSAATPIKKQKVAVIGTAGKMGALTFGFLQRAGSLFGTGLQAPQALGATAETATRLNRVLSKHFCLAFADESAIKLMNFGNEASIEQRLKGCDAVIMGGEFLLNERPVTAGTFETSPNSKTMEMYWEGDTCEESGFMQETVLANILSAAKGAGLKHIVGVGNELLRAKLESTGITYTCLEPLGQIMDVQDFTYRKGVQGSMSLMTVDDFSLRQDTPPSPIAREDLAALCVQALLSLDWRTSRHIFVTCLGAAEPPYNNSKRPDQEWCVNSVLLESAMADVQ